MRKIDGWLTVVGGRWSSAEDWAASTRLMQVPGGFTKILIRNSGEKKSVGRSLGEGEEVQMQESWIEGEKGTYQLELCLLEGKEENGEVGRRRKGWTGTKRKRE
ncbi:hypothetical protein B7463_g8390, partial [Scytalidium lignicola]